MGKQKVLIKGASAGFGSKENRKVEVRPVQKFENSCSTLCPTTQNSLVIIV